MEFLGRALRCAAGSGAALRCGVQIEYHLDATAPTGRGGVGNRLLESLQGIARADQATEVLR
ncbi:MAG: hypothetical protein ACRDX8_11375, partial [Acidimicrobiales bacterium]